MKSRKKVFITSVIGIGMALLTYFAWLFPFYEFSVNDYETSTEKLFSVEYLKTIVPLLIIVVLADVGIVLVVFVRKLLAKTDRRYTRFADVRTGRKKGKVTKPKPSVFMVARWVAMIVFFVIMIWGG